MIKDNDSIAAVAKVMHDDEENVDEIDENEIKNDENLENDSQNS